MEILPISEKLKQKIIENQLQEKWLKAKSLFEHNPRHPSLETELLEPKWRGIHSFRLDRKYRALFFITKNKAEVFQITNHYKKI
ncbi:hypothetical protein FJ208_01430 [Candidatus Gribaldobacteria bacterium]|nr:hypothetical protein [Candidatus Gribaldobacteria bacterium]